MVEKISSFSIIEAKEVKPRPVVVCGVPDAGLVGAIAASYLVRKLEMEEVGYLDSDELPPVLVFHKGKPSMPIRIYEKEGVVVIISEVAIPLSLMLDLAKAIVDWAIKKGAQRIVVLGGMPVPNRMEIEKPEVVGAAILDEDRELLNKLGIEVLKEGFLSRIHALIAKECFKEKVPCITLLAQSFLEYPDPGAAAAVLEKLSDIIGVDIDVKPLLEEEEEIRVKLRELMRKALPTIVRQTRKGYEYTTPLMYA